MPSPAPIVLFTFNRPEHTQKTLRALRDNELASDTELYVFCDGPRGADDTESTKAVRDIVRSTSGFGRVVVIERDENLGLARSVIGGIDRVLKQHEKVIVLEDDLLTSPYFLRFVNDGLDRYENDDRVISICGYTFPTDQPLPDTFFLPGAHCWGWATWRSRWKLFEHDPARLLRQIIDADLIYQFDVNGTDPHTQILYRYAQGDPDVDSWAIRWMGTAIVQEMLTLYPGKSLIKNTGFEGSGTHGAKMNIFDTEIGDQPIKVGSVEVAPNYGVLRTMSGYLIDWRKTWNRKLWLYYSVAALLPISLEKRLYSYLIRRSLKNLDSLDRG